MTALDELLAEPVDTERRRGRSLPAVVHGVLLPVETSCGIVSRSAQQASWAVERARRWIDRRHPGLEPLTNDDVLWLLLMGWEP